MMSPLAKAAHALARFNEHGEDMIEQGSRFRWLVVNPRQVVERAGDDFERVDRMLLNRCLTLMAEFCAFKGRARSARMRGHDTSAERLEAQCERIYSDLPEHWRWRVTPTIGFPSREF